MCVKEEGCVCVCVCVKQEERGGVSSAPFLPGHLQQFDWLTFLSCSLHSQFF